MRLIDADALRITLKHEWLNNNIDIGKFLDIIQCLKLVPTIDAKPVRHGKWIWYYRPGHYYCSECGFCADGYTTECIDGIFKFCPKCGVKIESVEDEELL